MANYGGFNYTGFNGVNLRNTAAVRFAGTSGTAIDVIGTLAVPDGVEAARAWRLPDKSGTLPIMGTFRVQLATGLGVFHSTTVTVSGVRAEDALVVQLNGVGVAGTTYGFAQSTGHIIVQAVPGNGNVTLYFNNTGQATGYVDLQASYLAAR